MFGVSLPMAAPPPLKPGSIQPTSSIRKMRMLGFLPVLAWSAASAWRLTGGAAGGACVPGAAVACKDRLRVGVFEGRTHPGMARTPAYTKTPAYTER